MDSIDGQFASGVALVRAGQADTARRRLGARLPVHVLSERTMNDLVLVINDAELARVSALPQFQTTARGLAAYAAAEGERRDVIGRELRDVPRVICAILALYLDSTAGGLTHSRLEAVSDLVGAGGRARAHALIAFMRFLGFIEPDPIAGDGRERRYRPLPRMREAFLRYVSDYLELVVPICPQATEVGDLLKTRERFEDFMAVTGESFLVGAMAYRAAFTEPSPMDLYSRRRSGMAMLWSLLLSAPDEVHWPPRDWIAINVTEIARRSGASRTHVQRMLRDSASAGHLVVDTERGVQVSDLLRHHVNAYLGVMIMCFGYFTRRVLADRTRDAPDRRRRPHQPAAGAGERPGAAAP
ncbi:MAG: hypothetical protein Q8J89_13620 [Caulobacter sp.]|nr:hypothetical protein [Caulobacter sp.]